ncbi:MAG: DUF805 domain-containing protein [Pseudomonadota bacterium]
MNFVDAVRTCFDKYVTFSGRATRPEYWYFVLFAVLAQLVGGTIDGLLFGFDEDAGRPIAALISLGLLLPGVSVAVRRLHDIGRPGWWLFLGLVPIVGFLVLVYFYIQPSQEGANEYDAPAEG